MASYSHMQRYLYDGLRAVCCPFCFCRHTRTLACFFLFPSLQLELLLNLCMLARSTLMGSNIASSKVEKGLLSKEGTRVLAMPVLREESLVYTLAEMGAPKAGALFF